MSDISADHRDRLNLREQIARVDDTLSRIARERKETQKFVAEQRRLMAEAKECSRDPWMLVAGAIIAGLFTRLPGILHASGIGR